MKIIYKEKSLTYCINIKSEYWIHFNNLAKKYGTIEKSLIFLISKHKIKLNKLSENRFKARLVLQPQEGTYIHKTFRMKDESVWELLNQFKIITGMTISLIIRLLIEWEIEDEKKFSLETLKTLGYKTENLNFDENITISEKNNLILFTFLMLNLKLKEKEYEIQKIIKAA